MLPALFYPQTDDFPQLPSINAPELEGEEAHASAHANAAVRSEESVDVTLEQREEAASAPVQDEEAVVLAVHSGEADAGAEEERRGGEARGSEEVVIEGLQGDREEGHA